MKPPARIRNRTRAEKAARQAKVKEKYAVKAELDRLAGKQAVNVTITAGPPFETIKALTEAVRKQVKAPWIRPERINAPMIGSAAIAPRRPGTAKQKTGDMKSPTIRRMIKAGQLQCAAPGHCRATAADPHHIPTSGSLGAIVDLLSFPACRKCHEKCHNGTFSSDQQRAALGAWWKFAVKNHPTAVRAAMKEMSE